MTSLPLQGLTVVAIEQAVAAPFTSSRLADAGARVSGGTGGIGRRDVRRDAAANRRARGEVRHGRYFGISMPDRSSRSGESTEPMRLKGRMTHRTLPTMLSTGTVPWNSSPM